MSRKRVVVGEDARGRPVSRWEDVPDEPPAFGHMQPAYDTSVQRRKATPEELAGREMRPRQTAAAALSGAPSARRPASAVAVDPIAQEETAVETQPIAEDTSPLAELVQAAMEADQAFEAFREAAPRWDAARARLAAAWRAVSGDVLARGETIAAPIIVPTSEVGRVGAGAGVRVELIDGTENITPVKPKRQPGHHGSKAGEAKEKAERARRVLEALETHGGNRQLAAASLGMRPNAFAMVLKHATLRQAASA